MPLGSILSARRNKEQERYYLLPGMGGRSLRRKRLVMLIWGIVIGVIVSIVVGLTMYYINSSH
jgi:hypothetical protein